MNNKDKIKELEDTIDKAKKQIQELKENYPPKGTPCAVWEEDGEKNLHYSNGDGTFSSGSPSEFDAYRMRWTFFQPLTTPKLGLWIPRDKMGLWVARDVDGALCAYTEKPIRKGRVWSTRSRFVYLSSDLFPDLKWEDKPLEI
jgi:hypothetical protein